MKKILLFISIYIILINNSFSEIVNDIKVENNFRISEETIITYGSINLGKDYDDAGLNQIIKNLYETNFFKNVSVKILDNTLIINVEENKIIQSF